MGALCIMDSIVFSYFHFVLLVSFLTCFIEACRIDYEPKKWQIGRQFFVSDKAPLTNVMNTISGAANNVQLLLDHIRNVENAVYLARITEEDNLDTNGREPFRTCNYREQRFRNSTYNKFGYWGWPFADTACVTDHFSESRIQRLNMTRTDGSKYTIEDIHIALSNYKNAVKDNSNRLVASIGINVSSADVGANHKMGFYSGEVCILQVFAGVRFDDIWYFRLGVLTRSLKEYLPAREREGFQEFPTVINGRFTSPKKMCVRLNNHTEERKEGTTRVGYYDGGGEQPFMFGQMTIDQNPSVKAALDKSDNVIQQANDALAPSNIAILVLPLFLNLVPIALLSTVTTSFMLFYTLLTDILTVIPLGIKGAELISIGSLTHKSVVVRISSSIVLPRSKSAAAELWSTECYAPSDVLKKGVFFLVLSLVFMVFGIMIEILAQVYMKQKSANRMNELEDAVPFVFKKGGNYGDDRLSRTSGEMQALQPTLKPAADSEKGYSLPQAASENAEFENISNLRETQKSDDLLDLLEQTV